MKHQEIIDQLKLILPDPSLIEIWSKINTQVFDDELLPCWLTRITSTYYGRHIGYWFGDTRTIQILHTHYHLKESIILHEMVHQWVDENREKVEAPTTWKKDWGRGKRTGTWNTKDADQHHDDPMWLMGVTHALEHLPDLAPDRHPYIKKQTTQGYAPAVLSEDKSHLIVLPPTEDRVQTYNGKLLTYAKYFPWDWDGEEIEL